VHADDPFPDHPDDATFKRYVSVLAKRVSKMPKLPMCRPDDDDWQVKLFAASGRFILSLHRRQGKRLIYPNEVVEKALGVSATTRNWNTIESIVKSLNAK
jgi:hypothetical protein